MDIGGDDIVIAHSADGLALDVAVRMFRYFWRGACFENSDTGEVYSDYAAIPFGQLRELFIYRDRAALDAWNAGNAPPGCMVGLIVDPGELTIVVDDRNITMARAYVRAVLSALDGLPGRIGLPSRVVRGAVA